MNVIEEDYSKICPYCADNVYEVLRSDVFLRPSFSGVLRFILLPAERVQFISF